MFVLTLIADTIRVPPALLARPTLTSVSSEIERRYPNRIVLDVGLILCPYGPPLEVGDGVLVPGDGGAHHQVVFRAVVFRPFVEEVLVGHVTESGADGIRVNVGGFFEHVHVPAYWMLNPSVYDERSGLWVWTPKYDDDEEEDVDNDGDDNNIDDDDDGKEENGKGNAKKGEGKATEGEEEEEDENRFEIEIGSEIRFKVKSVNFTRITSTMKGVQATTTSTTSSSASSNAGGGAKQPGVTGGANGVGVVSGNGSEAKDGAVAGDNMGGNGGVVRRRSSSADLTDEADADRLPAPMRIVGSICEDGLGLVSWWRTPQDDDEEEEEEEGDVEEGVGEEAKEGEEEEGGGGEMMEAPE